MIKLEVKDNDVVFTETNSGNVQTMSIANIIQLSEYKMFDWLKELLNVAGASAQLDYIKEKRGL